MEQHHNPFESKSARLLLLLGVFLVTNALLAEFIGVKIFSLENTFGWELFNWNLFGQSGNLNFTVGVILWPFVFIITDIINEYFGVKGVRRLSYMAVLFILYAFGIVFIAIHLAPAAFWPTSYLNKGVPDMQAAYAAIFGQGMWIIAGSVVAFLLGQIVDVYVFHKIKRMTGEKGMWLRSQGSTLVSQLIDSVVVLYIAFVLSGQWSVKLWLAIAIVNYTYKIAAAIVLTPLLYIVHHWIDKFLGAELSLKMREEAMKN